MEKVYSKNIGVYANNNQLQLCFLDTNTNNVYSVSDSQKIDSKNVVWLKDMFTIEDSFDNGHLCQTVEPVNNKLLEYIRTQKALAVLKNLSIYQQGLEWVDENEGYAVASVKEDKQLTLDKLAKSEKQLNSYNNNRNINGQMLALTNKNGNLEFCSFELPINSNQSKVYSVAKNQTIEKNDYISIYDWFKIKDGQIVCNPKITDSIKSKKSLKALYNMYDFVKTKHPCQISSQNLNKIENRINKFENEFNLSNQQSMQL